MTPDPQAASKLLSYLLRHNPAAIGARLDDGGWISIDALLQAATQHGHDLDHQVLQQVLAQPGKRRFEIRDGKIRAAQGHSIPVDLQLTATSPPPTLYHGTVARFLDRIQPQGLIPGQRNHVHLSASPDAAAQVGARRGKPVVLAINAAAMHQDGHQFYQAANGIWLTAHVPQEHISLDRHPDEEPHPAGSSART
jgi:putative RNA 2'-phosphotransferase